MPQSQKGTPPIFFEPPRFEHACHMPILLGAVFTGSRCCRQTPARRTRGWACIGTMRAGSPRSRGVRLGDMAESSHFREFSSGYIPWMVAKAVCTTLEAMCCNHNVGWHLQGNHFSGFLGGAKWIASIHGRVTRFTYAKREYVHLLSL